MAAYAWLKRKAIAAFSGAISKAANERFWGYLRRKCEFSIRQVVCITDRSLRETRVTFGYVLHRPDEPDLVRHGGDTGNVF